MPDKTVKDGWSMLMKFGSEKNLRKLQAGQLYMKNLKYYVDLEKTTDNEDVGDKYDGQMMLQDVKISMYTVDTHEFIAQFDAPSASMNLGYLFKVRYVTDERAYILLSDHVGKNPKSVLLEISENGDMLKTEFDCDFQLVFNMLVIDGKMFLGADKAVVVFDLQTKEIKAYTPISVEAEKHIIGISPINLADDRTFFKQCLLI